MSGVLTDFTRATIRDAAVELDAKVLTRPALLVTDGTNMTYAVDVDIGAGAQIKNVPIARANRDLIYADVGNAARLRRSAAGFYEVVGFSKQQPGTYTRTQVCLDDGVLGPTEDLTISAHVVNLGDLAVFDGGFGSTPLEAVAIYRGSTLLELRI